MYFLGFQLPFAVALDKNAEPPRDAAPTPGRCSFCKRQKEDTYRLTSEERVCADDIAAIVHRSGARRIRPQPRSVDWPAEVVAPDKGSLVPIDPWWERQIA